MKMKISSVKTSKSQSALHFSPNTNHYIDVSIESKSFDHFTVFIAFVFD